MKRKEKLGGKRRTRGKDERMGLLFLVEEKMGEKKVEGEKWT